MSDDTTPSPDRFGRFRVAETVDGKTRHYSTKRFLPGVHKIVEGGPDSDASYANGQERPPKFPAPARQADAPAARPASPATTTPTAADSPKGADK